MEYKIMQGVWGDKLDTFWEFFLADKLPADIPTSAVMGLPFFDGKIVLTHTKRGWEIPGGHIETGEDVQACLERELWEEVGASAVSSVKLFGYRKITNPDRKVFATSGKKYPRYTVVPYYLVELSSAPAGAQASDSIDSGTFQITDALVANSHDYLLITLAIAARAFLDR